jgi:hypothetical protein
MSTTYIASKHMPRVRFADHAERLTCKRTFAEETTITQYADRGFLAGFGNNGESHLAGLQIKHCRLRSIVLKGELASSGSPMIRIFLVIQMTHARDKRRVTLCFRPVYGFLLCPETGKLMVGMILDTQSWIGDSSGRPFGRAST